MPAAPSLRRTACLLGLRRFSSSPSPPVVDLRSDTVTRPSAAMRRAMAEAEVGNDVYEECPTVKRLESRAAELFGKESSLFVLSGTMANLLAATSWCRRRGEEAFVGNRTHVFLHSQACLPQLAGVQAHNLPTDMDNGTFDLDVLRERAVPNEEDFHYSRAALVYAENSHNESGGRVLPEEWVKQLLSFCRRSEIPAHLDGARLLNASVSSGRPLSALAEGFSSVSMCVSKGVGAPIGSVLAGDREFVARARRTRKALGGGATQIGVLAAAALVGLDDAEERMGRDHEHAKLLARVVQDLGSKYVSASERATETNMVVLHTKCVTPAKLCSRLSRVTDEERRSLGDSAVGVWAFPRDSAAVRLVTHSDLSSEDIARAAKKIAYVVENITADISKE